ARTAVKFAQEACFTSWNFWSEPLASGAKCLQGRLPGRELLRCWPAIFKLDAVGDPRTRLEVLSRLVLEHLFHGGFEARKPGKVRRSLVLQRAGLDVVRHSGLDQAQSEVSGAAQVVRGSADSVGREAQPPCIEGHHLAEREESWMRPSPRIDRIDEDR